MHITRLVDLRHGRVHQRVTGLAGAPGLEQRIGMRPFFPDDGVECGFKTLAYHLWVVHQDLEVKVAPYQLTQPHSCTRVALLAACVGNSSHFADRHRAKPQVHTQITWPLHGGEVAGGMVLVHAVHKLTKQRPPAARTGGYLQLGEIGGRKAQFRQRGHWLLVFGGPWRQRRGVTLHRVRLQVKSVVRQLAQPRIFVRREHTEGCAALGQHLVTLKNAVVFVGV